MVVLQPDTVENLVVHSQIIVRHAPRGEASLNLVPAASPVDRV
jgi:hypothetical protein